MYNLFYFFNNAGPLTVYLRDLSHEKKLFSLLIFSQSWVWELGLQSEQAMNILAQMFLVFVFFFCFLCLPQSELRWDIGRKQCASRNKCTSNANWHGCLCIVLLHPLLVISGSSLKNCPHMTDQCVKLHDGYMSPQPTCVLCIFILNDKQKPVLKVLILVII